MDPLSNGGAGIGGAAGRHAAASRTGEPLGAGAGGLLFSHSGVRPGGGFEHGFNDGDGLYLACGAGGVCLRRTF